MDSRIFVKPLEGLLVRIPGTRVPLPQAGTWVFLVGSEGNFWRRRLNDGTVVVGEPPGSSDNLNFTASQKPMPVEKPSHTRRRHNTNEED